MQSPTEGRWIAEDFGDSCFTVLRIEGDETLPVAYTNDVGDVDEEWANACLMAAAPDLLEAAETVQRYLDAIPGPIMDQLMETEGVPPEDMRVAIAKAREAR